jgi:hypothetical protein
MVVAGQAHTGQVSVENNPSARLPCWLLSLGLTKKYAVFADSPQKSLLIV